MAPPGVATRNASGDPLRTPEEASAMSEKRPHTQPTSKSELTAIELLNDSTTGTNLRASLELDIIHMGAYRPGTLRITNGRASPDPSFLLKDTDLGHRASTLPEDFQTAPNTPERGQALSLRQIDGGDSEIRETIIMCQDKRQISGRLSVDPASHENSTSAPELRRASEPAVLCNLNPLKDEVHPLRALKTTPFQRASMVRDQPRERAHSQAELSPHQREPHTIRTVENSPMKQREGETSRQSTNVSSRQSLEPNVGSFAGSKRTSATATAPQLNEPTAKTGMPRFAQRWSQRLSHLASESTAESQLPSNPFEDNSALQSLSKRLSTVTDRTIRERQESSARETPEVALAKLTGEIDRPIYKQAGDGLQTDTSRTPMSSAEDVSHARSRRSSQPQKTDSGYGSDVLPTSKEAKQSRDVDPRKVYTITEQTHKAYEGLPTEDDTVSLYSVNQVLKSPYLLSGLAMPSPPAARGSKKHLSLLGINKLMDQNDNNDIAGEPTDPSPVETKTVRPHKKLQKPMPAAVRNSFKSALTRRDEKRRSKTVMSPDLHDDLEDTFAEQYDPEEPRDTVDGLARNRSLTNADGSTETTETAEATAERTNSTATISPTGSNTAPAMYSCRETRAKEDVTVSVPLTSVRENTGNGKRSGSTTPRASNFEISHISCFNNADASGERAAKARGPLTSHPPTPTTAAFNPSTKILNRTVTVPGVQQASGRTTKEKRSSFRTSRQFGTPNTAPEMASDASRRHSRLMAKQKNEEVLESLGFIPSLPKRRSKVDAKTTVDLKESLKSKQLPPTPVANTDERPGDATESIADVVRRAAEARKAGHASNGGTIGESRPRKSRKSKTKESARVEIHELDISSTEDLRNTSSRPEIVATDSANTESSNWEQHVETWRHQRESIEQKIGTPSPLSDELNVDAAPTIIVSEPISPLANTTENHFDTGRPRSDSAEKHAQEYRELIDADGSDEAPQEPEATKEDSMGAEHIPVPASNSSGSEERVDSAYAIKSYHSDAPQIERSRSPGGRVVTPSGHFFPYNTAQAESAEQSHSNSVGRSEDSTPHTPAESKSISRRSLPPNRAPLDSLIDRYGGGRMLPKRSGAVQDQVVEA